MKLTPETEKTFDCIAFKREAQRRIYDEIRGMTPAQEIDYFRRAARSGPLSDWWRRISESEEHRAPSRRA